MKNKKQIITISLIALAIIVVTASVTYAFFTYSSNGQTENTITAGGITFHYKEVDGMGRGISITDALPVTSNETARSSGTAFNFKITSNAQGGVQVPYVVTARLNSGSSIIMGDIVDLYLKDDTSATDIFESGEVKYNDLNQYQKVSGYTEKVIYEGTTTGNYEKNFELRMWIDQNANYAKQCDKKSETGLYQTQTACEEAGGNWDYLYNDKSFNITVNVYAGESSKNTYAASSIQYTPNSATTTCTGSNATLECALDELNSLLD